MLALYSLHTLLSGTDRQYTWYCWKMIPYLAAPDIY